VRIKRLLSLCLPLLLVACSGGGYLAMPTSAPEPTPSAGGTRAPVLTLAAPAATPSPTPTLPPALSVDDILNAPERSPELAGGLLTAEERDRYVQYIAALRGRDKAAAWWLVSSGLLLKDGKLGLQDGLLMKLVLSGNDDALWYLMRPRLQDGVSQEDLDALQAADATPTADWLLDSDLHTLQAQQLVSAAGERGLERVFTQAKDDPELRLGLAIIGAYGVPDASVFKYPVPNYNVALRLLGHLLERGLPVGYERAAVAAACTYGSLATVCDDAARQQVFDYADERVRFLIDADVQLAAAGASWHASSYPLEALITLLWAGQSTAFPQAGQPLAQAPSLLSVVAGRPLTKDDLPHLLADLDTLQAMQDEMMRVTAEHTTDGAAAAERVEQWWSEHQGQAADDGGPNLNHQWALYQDSHSFAGGAEAAYVLQALAASINLPMPWVQLWYADQGRQGILPAGLRIDPAANALSMDDQARQATASLPGEAKAVLIAYQVPWDNWHLQQGVRSCVTLPLPMSIWRGGVPAGYLLRSGILSEPDALNALGLSAAK